MSRTWYGLSEEDRFWAKVSKDSPSGCWEWEASLNAWGYGTFKRSKAAGYKTILAHRMSFLLASGDVPDIIDHICFNRRCVNPDHLAPSDPVSNGRRRSGANKNSKTGVRGVSPNQGGFYAQVKGRPSRWFKDLRSAREWVESERRSTYGAI